MFTSYETPNTQPTFQISVQKLNFKKSFEQKKISKFHPITKFKLK